MEELQSLNPKPAFRFSETSVSKINWGILLLGFFSVASASASGYFLKLFFESGSWNCFGISFAAVIIFLAVFLLDIIFVKSFLSGSVISLLSSLGIIAVFYDWLSYPLLAGVAVVYLFLAWGVHSGMKEMDNMIKIKFWRIGKKSLSKAAVGLLIFSSVAFYFSAKSLILKSPESFFVSQPTFKILLSPTEPLIKKFLPEFGFEKTFGDFSRDMAIDKVNSDKQADSLSGEQRESLVVALDSQAQGQVSNMVGTNIDPKMKISDIIYEILLNKIINLPAGARSVFPYAAAVVIFFTLYMFLWIFRGIATSLSFLIYEFFLALGVAVITLEGDSREEIALKSNHNYSS